GDVARLAERALELGAGRDIAGLRHDVFLGARASGEQGRRQQPGQHRRQSGHVRLLVGLARRSTGAESIRGACAGQAKARAPVERARARGGRAAGEEWEERWTASAGAGSEMRRRGGGGEARAPRRARPYSSALAGAAVGVTVAEAGALAAGGEPAIGRLGACAYLARRSRMSCA